MALSVVYFRNIHHLGRPRYVWEEYLYSVLEEVKVRVILSVNSLCNVIVLCEMTMKGRKKMKFGAGS